ncbi:MAG: hypothetical protein B9S32_11075 [Verrucomicrobia bacterium Tous-C9LFEB]|nr:MAG: hypothetical protein B9S32_11075 [Verrucomicrobia bacterium Tous-C9LFEB]
MDPAPQSGSFSGIALVLGRAQTVLIHSFEWLLYACVALYGFAPQITAPDLGWHLAQADWMIHHGAFLRQDVFNYPNLHAPLINEYPFYQAVIWLAWRLGEMGAATLCAGLLVLLYALYFRAGRRLHFPTALLGASLFLSVVLSLGRFTVRPELATSLGIVFFLTFLLRHREEGWKAFWPLVLGQVLWVNAHSGFILGPALVVGFGIEMTLRAAWSERRFPRGAALHWAKVSALVLGACFFTPYGPVRLWLPFYHQGNELIRAYVTEMQPLVFNPFDFTVIVMLLQLALIALACLRFRGGLSWSFLILALFFFRATFTSERHLAIFALLAPGVALSAIVFEPRKRERVATAIPVTVTSSIRPFLVALVLMLGVLLLLNEELRPTSTLSPVARWKDWNQRQTELPLNAVEWMKQQGLNGRLFHRSEFGGWLQYVGYNQGQTYCDTGFGKYSESMIHEIGLASEQPTSLPVLLRRYRPDITIVANMAYNWPYYLRQEGWRCVFYAPDGSVWLPNGAHPELSEVTCESIAQRFVANHEQNGFPSRAFLYYRQLLTLHSMGRGCNKLAFTQLMQLPTLWQSKFLFWEVARKMVTAPPYLSREPLVALYALAEKPENQPASLLFRATVLAQRGEWKAVISLLGPLPRHTANDIGFTLLSEALMETGRVNDAAPLLRENDLFAIANVRRYELLARVEEQLGHADAAAKARDRAKLFGPLEP